MLLLLRDGGRAVGRQLHRARAAQVAANVAVELLHAAASGQASARKAPSLRGNAGALRAYTHNSLPSPSHMSVADLLEVSKQFRSKQTNYIYEHQTLGDAVKSLAKNENSATLVVVNQQKQVVGMLTNHLALQRIVKLRKQSQIADWAIKVRLPILCVVSIKLPALTSPFHCMSRCPRS